ncbi:hypothetical protein IQ238_16145 [Pleurocapsales cyanobacterium LEGE 06147]|nr:hypothetical protein [Pleurocapsales cyanobacterium LEGE 06147]
MAQIRISGLNSAGSELFADGESFLQELAEDELAAIAGGFLKINLSNLSILSEQSFDFNYFRAQGTAVSGLGNSVNNNTINGQTYNANSVSNINTPG